MSNTNTIILLALLASSVYIIYMQFKISDEKCPPKDVVYKFIPRTFKEEQIDPVKVADIFEPMFTERSLLV